MGELIEQESGISFTLAILVRTDAPLFNCNK